MISLSQDYETLKSCWRTEFLESNLTGTNNLIILRPDNDGEKVYLHINYGFPFES